MDAIVEFEVLVLVRGSGLGSCWWENRGTFNNEVAAEVFAEALAEGRGESVRVERRVTS